MGFIEKIKMADNIRDRVLTLRVLPPQLLQTLKKKIVSTGEKVATAAVEKSKQEQKDYRSKHASDLGILLPMPAATTNTKEGQISDLEGVHCQPTENGSTLWEFKCDKKTYPARLVNLPCPLEVQKTYDHSMYYKCADIGQMLIVYENRKALEEAEGTKDYKIEEFPSYFHSGMTPPMKRVVQRRFKAREHKNEPYRRDEVSEVMTVLKQLVLQIRPDASKNKSKSKSYNNSSSDASKIIEVIEDDEVMYEPWMDNHGKTPEGIEFDETDALCYKHPELWLDPKEKALMEEQERKKKSKKKKKNQSETMVVESGNLNTMGMGLDLHTNSSSHKKGIASKKNRENKIDEVTQAALSIHNNTEDDDLAFMLGEDDFDFDGDDALNFD